jgi:hypothetical protein
MTDGPYAAMRVTDTGPGIPAGMQKSIFEPFFTTKPQGTGLGTKALVIDFSHAGSFLPYAQGGGSVAGLEVPPAQIKGNHPIAGRERHVEVLAMPISHPPARRGADVRGQRPIPSGDVVVGRSPGLGDWADGA